MKKTDSRKARRSAPTPVPRTPKSAPTLVADALKGKNFRLRGMRAIVEYDIYDDNDRFKESVTTDPFVLPASEIGAEIEALLKKRGMPTG